jgi:uncharacterized protein YndB with AHSA1/START domain
VIDFEIATHIDRPVADVFRHVCDPQLLCTWQTNTVSAVVQDGAGPIGLGTRLHEVHRAPGGRELASVVEVSEFEPDRVLGLRVVEGTPVHARFEFVADADDGGGTVVRMHGYGRLAGALRFAQPLLQRVLRRQFQGDLGRLKRVLETPRAAAR